MEDWELTLHAAVKGFLGGRLGVVSCWWPASLEVVFCLVVLI